MVERKNNHFIGSRKIKIEADVLFLIDVTTIQEVLNSIDIDDDE